MKKFPLLPLPQSFWIRVDKTVGQGPRGECWSWVGRKTSGGYGQLNVDGKTLYAHRVAWFVETGIWPLVHTCHHCDYPSCVRFSHLFQGTDADNLADMARKSRGHGPQLKGELHPQARLTADQVLEIRRRCALGEKQRKIAADFAVRQGTISFIVTRQTWGHL